MSNLRFYSSENLHVGATIKLSDNAAKHATRVMRLNVGDALTLFNGDGADYECALISIKKSETLAKVNASVAIQNESNLNITLLQGISAGDRMDISIQKAVELGVNAIVPINTQRSVVKLTPERAQKRLEHWQNVVIAACEQSGRANVPQVFAPINLSHWLANNTANPNQARITLAPTATHNFKSMTKPLGEIILLVGAEGGLSADEIALASNNGFSAVTLGPRILRTETAPLAAIAAMQTLWGDF